MKLRNTSNLISLALMMLMLLTAASAWWLRPTILVSDLRPPPSLEKAIPLKFGDWTSIPELTDKVINPSAAESVANIYSQTLSRTYVNEQGIHVMLSIAYSATQTDYFGLHYPESCYAAQGFSVKEIGKDLLKVNSINIPIKRLFAKINNRAEFITYWTVIGDFSVGAKFDAKLVGLKYGTKGQIPDGLLFRISTIKVDTENDSEIQDRFINDLLKVMPERDRIVLTGQSSVQWKRG